MDSATHNLDKIVELFLEKENSFGKGMVINSEDLERAISALGKVPHILDKSPNYKAFLLKYGSIYGSGLSMLGPLSEKYGDKFQEIMLMLKSFDNYCKMFSVNETQLKYWWFVAEYNHQMFFIDSSESGRDLIYSLDTAGNLFLFAEDFITFLNIMFQVYVKDAGESSTYCIESDTDSDESDESDSDDASFLPSGTGQSITSSECVTSSE